MTDEDIRLTARPVHEIQAAHDLMGALASGRIPMPEVLKKYPTIETQILIASDVLCWILGDSREEEFGKLLFSVQLCVGKVDQNGHGYAN